jgi:hypothetical protein
MSLEVKDALREAVTMFGTDLGSDARRCRAVLLDWCPRKKREIRVLEATVEEGVPEAILAKRIMVPRVVLIESLAKQVYENQGIDLELSRWSVGAWMDALEGQSAKGTRTMNQGTANVGTSSIKPGGAPQPSRWLLKLTLVVVVLGFFGGIVYGLVWSVSALVNGGKKDATPIVTNGGTPKPPVAQPPRADPTPPKKDPPKVDPPIAQPKPAPKPVSGWDDPVYVTTQGTAALARLESLRERLAARQVALGKNYDAAKASRADAASLNVYVPRAYQKAVDEDRWPFRASGYTFTRAQGDRLIEALKKYLADADAPLKQGEALITSFDGLTKDATDTKARLLCALGLSTDPGCSGVKPTRETVEPLIGQVGELEKRGAQLAADPTFVVLDVSKLAGPP